MVDPDYPSFSADTGRPLNLSFGLDNDVFWYIRSKIDRIPHFHKRKPWGLQKHLVRKVVEKALNMGHYNQSFTGLYSKQNGTVWDTVRWSPNFDHNHPYKHQIDRIMAVDAVEKTKMSIKELLALPPWKYEYILTKCEESSKVENKSNAEALKKLQEELNALDGKK